MRANGLRRLPDLPNTGAGGTPDARGVPQDSSRTNTSSVPGGSSVGCFAASE